jgi:hypothetical protein
MALTSNSNGSQTPHTGSSIARTRAPITAFQAFSAAGCQARSRRIAGELSCAAESSSLFALEGTARWRAQTGRSCRGAMGGLSLGV